MVKYGKYGESAIYAVKILLQGKIISTTDAWAESTGKFFSKSITSQKKVCPKGSFLGLCEEGYIKGVPTGNYTKSKKNKSYATKAVRLLKEKPGRADNKKQLWIKACGSKNKKHNSQMDVVLALMQNDFINQRSFGASLPRKRSQ